MQKDFIKALYKSIVKENLEQYIELYETTDESTVTDDYFKETINFYKRLDNENKEILMKKIIEQTMIDTISNMLGIIDGSTTVEHSISEPKLLLDSLDTEGELQDYFLEFLEEVEDN